MVTNKQIQKWNNYFESLSPEEKRVAIAKDVLAQMKSEKINVTSGIYFDIEDIPEDSSISLQKYLPETQCNVCALGALFHSHIKFNNKVTYRDYSTNVSGILIPQNLQNYFDFEQMVMIEYAFEGFVEGIYKEGCSYIDLMGIGSDGPNGQERLRVPSKLIANLQKCHDYYNHLELNDKQEGYDDFKLYQIMHNIIRNNGTFVPTDLKLEKWKKKTK